ncbi:MAG: cephalosporin hydroxylase family protein [Planctomycetes bacterium]|nr:cephalosporin hydroxylase family protein [Planctomycetota bacterium]MBU2457829.1 cephalosporin hydroxylase family protein [Planctomycetota bacterium]
MRPNEIFQKECIERVRSYKKNHNLVKAAAAFMRESTLPKYSYNFSWLGHPIIQYPQDIVAMQEIIWNVQPDLIIETGIAHGGSVIFSASMIALLEKCGCIEMGHVIAIDIDIREHNRIEIEKHPLCPYITMIQGSSIDGDIAEQVKSLSKNYKKILISLDSNHTHSHVLKELELYAPLVSVGSYCDVFDTIIENMPENSFLDRPWDKGNNPKTAVKEFLKHNNNFVIDNDIEHKLLITVAPDGYLKRIK